VSGSTGALNERNFRQGVAVGVLPHLDFFFSVSDLASLNLSTNVVYPYYPSAWRFFSLKRALGGNARRRFF
jgi:hypothetical protein